MTETKQNVVTYRGDDTELIVTVTDGRAVINITTASAIEWDLYQRDGTFLTSVTLDDGISFDDPDADPTHGVFVITLPHEFMADYDLGRYEHKGAITLNGLVKTIFTGYFWIKDAES